LGLISIKIKLETNEHQIVGFLDGSNYAPFNLGLRHHVFGPYAPHLQVAKYYTGIRHHVFGPYTPHL